MKSWNMKLFVMVFLCVAMVFSGLACFAQASQMELAGTAEAPQYQEGQYTAKAQGYGGYVYITLTIDKTGRITEVKLQGDKETPDVGGYALDDYQEDILKAQSADLDTYAGATLTSKAVLEAAEMALAEAQKSSSDSPYASGVYTAKAKGYGGYIVATITIGPDGGIEKVTLEGDHETPDIGGYAMDDMESWILKAQSANIDSYTGATFTSNGVIEAVKAALDQAAVSGENAGYQPGIYEAKAKGYGGYVSVKLTIDASGRISQVEFHGDSETPDVGGLVLETYPELVISTQSGNLDVVTGATHTSKAAIEAVQAALEMGKK